MAEHLTLRDVPGAAGWSLDRCDRADRLHGRPRAGLGSGRRRRCPRLGAGNARDGSPPPDRPRRADQRDLPRRWLGLRARRRRRRHAPPLRARHRVRDRHSASADRPRRDPLRPRRRRPAGGSRRRCRLRRDAGCRAKRRPLEGRIGAGTGATVAKMAGHEQAKPGGVGSAARRLPDGSTSAPWSSTTPSATSTPATELRSCVPRRRLRRRPPATRRSSWSGPMRTSTAPSAASSQSSVTTRWRSGSGRRTRSSTATSSSR